MSDAAEVVDVGVEDFDAQDDQVIEQTGQQGGEADSDPTVSEAREQGWVPFEEYNGPKDKWVDANEFLERGKKINPILRKENRKLVDELKASRAEIQRIREEAKKVNAFMKESFEARLRRIEADREQAILEGDVDAVKELDTALADTKQRIAEVEPASTPRVASDEFLTDWATRNPWVDMAAKNDRVKKMSIEIRNDYMAENPGATMEDALEYVGEQMRELFPATTPAKKPAAAPAPAMERGSAAAPVSPSNGGSINSMYAKLPAEARATCDKWVKDGLITKEEYVRSYWEQ